MPVVSSADNGKILSVVNGAWASSNGLNTLSNNLGDLSNLTTTTKTSAVAAINEVSGQIATIGEITISNIQGNPWTVAGMSYTNLFTLSAGTYIVVVNYAVTASGIGGIICHDNNWLYLYGDTGASGSACIVDITTTKTIQFYSNTSNNSNYSYYRFQAQAIRIK